ncbi:XdhC family protein [Gemmata sp.]|uniref:XdhC family protein n=1 Tax=Gemmata sp. TaxID=1914242 RepID=UPI003F718001
MHELGSVVSAAAALAPLGEPAVLATVVRVEGWAQRHAGTRLLIDRAGEWAAGIGGPSLGGELLRTAWQRTEAGPCVARYDTATDDETAWLFGLGYNGVVHVLLERVGPGGPDPLAFARHCLRENEPGVLATVVRTAPGTGVRTGDRVTLDAHGRVGGSFDAALTDLVAFNAADALARRESCVNTYLLPAGEVDVFLEVIQPPRRLVVFGAGPDAVPLVTLAKSVGWHVTVVDARASYARQPAFAAADEVVVAPTRKACESLVLDENTAAVVMNHNFSEDLLAIDGLLAGDAAYIGVLGPWVRAEKVLAELDRHSDVLSPDRFARIHAPVGLDIGARNAEEIAVAVVAQIAARFANRPGGDLCHRPSPAPRREPVGAEVLV